MIITKEEFNEKAKTYEGLLELIRESNKETHKFWLQDGRLIINRTAPKHSRLDGISIQFSKESYIKPPISREMLMTDEEFDTEVREGRVRGVRMKEDGRLVF